VDDVSDFQQRLEQFQKGKQFGSVRSVQMGAIQGGSPFTYYPQGMSVSQNRFQAPNAGIQPKLGGNEKPRYGANPSIYSAVKKSVDDFNDKMEKQNKKTSGNAPSQQNPLPKGTQVQQDNEDDSYMDAVYSTTAQGQTRVSAKNQGLADAMEEVASEMDDRPDMSGKRGFRGGLAVGITDNDRGWKPETVSEAQGVFVGTAINVAKEAWTNRPGSRAQKRSTPAGENRQRESGKFANPDFDPFT
jgi:hypothetical protein